MCFQMYNLHLTNGAVIRVAEDYDLPMEKGIVEKYRNAKMDDVLSVCVGLGYAYIPKRTLFSLKPVM